MWVAQALGYVHCLAEESRRALVITHPERHEPSVEVRPPAERLVPFTRLQHALEPLRALLEAPLGQPEPVKAVGHPKRLVVASLLDEPRERGENVVELRVESLEGRLGVGTGESRRQLLDGCQVSGRGGVVDARESIGGPVATFGRCGSR